MNAEKNSYEEISPPERIEKTYSISRRLTVSLIVTVATVATIGISLIYWNTSQRAKRELEYEADEILAYLIGTLEMPLWDINFNAIKMIARTVTQNELIIKLTIKDSSGKYLFSHDKRHDLDLVNRTGKIYHEGYFIGEIDISMTKYFYQKSNRSLLLYLAIVTTFILVAIILVTGFLIRTFLRKPLNSLNKIVDSYAAGAYDSAVVKLLDVEFRPFRNILAQMGEKIKAQIGELQEAEAKYRSIFEHAIEGIFQSTHEGCYIRANPSMARILGYSSPDDLMASTTDIRRQQYVVPSHRDELFRRFEYTNTVSDFEVQFYRKDKKTIWVSLNARVVRDEDGRLMYLEGFLTDITKRKHAEDELIESEKRLRKSEQRFRDLFASISDVIFTHDLNGRFLSMNPATCKLLGYAEKELTGRCLSDFMKPRVRRCF